MPKVIADITVSLAVDSEILERATAQSGAVAMCWRLFDVVDAPDG